jgi:hypothetical protein
LFSTAYSGHNVLPCCAARVGTRIFAPRLHGTCAWRGNFTL